MSSKNLLFTLRKDCRYVTKNKIIWKKKRKPAWAVMDKCIKQTLLIFLKRQQFIVSYCPKRACTNTHTLQHHWLAPVILALFLHCKCQPYTTSCWHRTHLHVVCFSTWITAKTWHWRHKKLNSLSKTRVFIISRLTGMYSHKILHKKCVQVHNKLLLFILLLLL